MSTMASYPLNFLLFLFLTLIFSGGLDASPRDFPVDAIFQFGDSISDTGNLIRDNPAGAFSTFARLPYGRTTFHYPTGRCSNGLLMIDYFTSFFKLPLLNPYLDRGANFSHGVNFAVGGSTALNASFLGANRIASSLSNSSLSVQLGWFKSHLQTICPNTSECKEKLKRTLFLMGEIGGNDYNYALFQGKTVQELIEMVPEVVQAITTAVQEVIHYGAVRVIIPGNFPLGCSPLYLSQIKTNDSTMYDDLHCIKALNDFAKFHNILLQQGIQELQQQHPNVSIVYADYYSALTGILQNASSLGFDKKVVQKACCGIGDNDYNFNTTQMCGMPNVPVCSKPKKYVSWDGIHMTQHAYRLMAKWLLKGIVKSMFNKA